MTPEEIALFNARLRLEQSIRGGVNGFNPADPILQLESTRSLPSALNAAELRAQQAAQQLQQQQQLLNRTLSFSPSSSGGLPDFPSTSLKVSNYGTSFDVPTESQQLQQTTGSRVSSVGSQVGLNLVNAVSGLAGISAGTAASTAAFGGGSGIGNGVGGTIGGVVGGAVGTALGAAGSFGLGAAGGGIVGSFVGSALGAFIGGGLEKLVGGLFGAKPNRSASAPPSSDLGSGYVRPNPNVATGGTGEGQNAGVGYCIQLRVDYENFSHPPTFHIVATDSALNFFDLKTREETAQVGTAYEGAITSVGISRRVANGVFIQVNGVDRNSFINNQNFGAAVVGQVSIVHIVRKDGRFDPPPFITSPNADTAFSPNNGSSSSEPIDVLGEGESYILGTGYRQGSDRFDGIGVEPITALPVIARASSGASSGTAGSSSSSSSSSSGSEALGGLTGGQTGGQTGTSGSTSTGTSTSSSASANSGAIPAFAQPAFSAKPFVSGVSDPRDYGKEIDNATGKERIKGTGQEIERLEEIRVDPNQERKPTPTPIPNPAPAIRDNPEPVTPNASLAPVLTQIAAVLAGVTALKLGSDLLVNNSLQNTPKINQIANNTTPQAQQTNAANGACTALNSSSCTANLANSITEPVINNSNANQAATTGKLAELALSLGAILTAITTNFSKLFTFLDVNAKVEAVKSTIVLALTLHNALMLSQSLGDTLGLIIDNVLNVFGNTFKSSDGTAISTSEFLGATVKQWIINVIGVENYTQLADTLAKANRIYQTGMNILSTVQGVFDAAASAAQASGIKLSLLMNGLRDESVVSPRAYGHQDESPAGNRATTLARFEQLTTTISDLDSKAQNLVTITSAPIQVKEAIKQSKEDIKAFNDARDASSEVNVQAKEARIDAIKQLKPLTEVTIAKRDDDT
ncbi:MAG: hypothetical protein DCE90_14005 [Pseudanabaena sp.]|nr:MAG: hypothetical protein DCE90_14005 [Pseudanabaena sp.]